MKAVVITGVSTGLGYAMTKTLTENGITVFGSVRNEQDAERLVKAFGQLYIPLIFDVTDVDKVKQAASFVRQHLNGNTLWGLINNAGMLVPGPLLYLSIDELKKQLDVNIVGQVIVTQAFTPLLGMDPQLKGSPGKIINISSVVGKRVTLPFMGAYSISKHGIEAMSDTLRIELIPFGIEVIVIGPGAIQSMIWEKSTVTQIPQEVEESVYYKPISFLKNYFIKTLSRKALPAEVIGNLALTILKTSKPKLRYAPVPNKFTSWTLPNLIPKRFLNWLVAKKLGLLQ